MRDNQNINPPDGSKLEVKNYCLFVDGKPFVVDYPEETIIDVCTENRLMTRCRGHLINFWRHDEIEGYYA